ncbi:MAG: N-acetylmuramoyl-L-alanine amidase [Calditrichia bacterium]
MAVFCTDPGHGGRDPGAVWQNVLEKDLNLEVTLQLNEELKRRQHRILTSRKSDDHVPDLNTRCKLVNAHHRKRLPEFDAIVSVHCNVAAYRDPVSGGYVANQSTRGFHVIYSQESVDGTYLAKCMATAAEQEGILLHRGGRISTVELGRSLAWVHKTIPTAVLIELGFMTSPDELRQLRNSDYQRRLVRGIANGLDKFVSVS